MSVVIAAYRPTYLGTALASATNQTHRDIEVVLVDDSRGREVHDLVRHLGDSRVRYLRNEANCGPALSHARAIAEASGPVLGVLNDDDVWEPNLVDRLLGALEAWPTATVAFGDHWVMVDGKKDDAESDRVSRATKRYALAPGMHRPFHRMALIDKSIPLAVGTLFRKAAVENEQIPREVGGAYDLFLSYLLSRDGAGAVYVPERLATWRMHGRNLTNEASCARAEEGVALMQIVMADPRVAVPKPELAAAYGSALWNVATRNLRIGSRRRAVRAIIQSVRQGHLRSALLLPATILPGRLLLRF